MSRADRVLALSGKREATPSDVQSAINITNEGVRIAKHITPDFAKEGLTGIKHLGERGVGFITDSRIGQYAANKVAELTSRVRTGKALSFNAGKVVTSLSGIKTVGDIANIEGISQFMIIIIAILFFMIFWWCFSKLNLNKQNCTIIEKTFDKFPFINNINPDNPTFKNRLRDYYIKTAYNCCASGNFKNDFVNLCALKNCIKQGARCLDFEIYSVENAPVIAVSASDSFNIKESYNFIPFAKAMDVISTYAFSSGNCPNPNDPLILHFRIKSSSQDIQNAMANALYNTLEDRLLGPDFSYENNGLNIGAFPIAKLMGKVVIIVDKSNPIFTETLLNEYVNIASNSAFMRSLRYKDVEFTPDTDELILFNKQNMTICLPDLSARNKNYSSALAMTYGCQMMAMSFQNFDDNLNFYFRYFDDAGSAFVLRPERLRYIPTFIPIPIPQNPAVSYGTATTNPLGSDGPESLNITITTDNGGLSEVESIETLCGKDDSVLAYNVSDDCINSLAAKYGKCKLEYRKDPDNSKGFLYKNKDGITTKTGDVNSNLTTLKANFEKYYTDPTNGKRYCINAGGISML